MFSVDEKVVYAGHGVAKINRIIEKNVGGASVTFLELKFLAKEMIVLIPVHNLVVAGLRRLSSFENINEAFKIMSEPVVAYNKDITNSNWNKRNKEYQCKLRTGGLFELCMIYKELKSIALYKELSFGEKNLLNQTEVLLAQEIAIVMDVSEEKAMERLRFLINHNSIKAPAIAKQISK